MTLAAQKIKKIRGVHRHIRQQGDFISLLTKIRGWDTQTAR
jgi:hypothetical protein